MVPLTAALLAATPALDLSGYVQVDGVMWHQASVEELDPSTGEPLSRERVLVRRARLRAEATEGPFATSLEVDGNTVRGPQARLIAAEVAVRGPFVRLSAGLMKIPFGDEVQQKTQERLFLEATRGARAFFPGDYDLGVQLRGNWRFLRAQVAAMDGVPTGERAFPGRDPDGRKDLLGRLGVEVDIGPDVVVQAGASALTGHGFHAGAGPTKDTVAWRDVNENGRVELTELQPVAGRAATPSETFERFALGGDARIVASLPVVGPLEIFTELTWGQNLDRGVEPADPVSAGRDLRERAVAAGATLGLPAGAVLGARWDRYDPDADASDLQGAALVPQDATYSTWALLAAWRYGTSAAVIIEYDHERNALGRDAAGRPTTLASDALTLRLQGGL